jgi:hypothetical protein
LVVLIHLRFLRNIKLSFWQTYSNPVFRSSLISSGFSVTLTVKLSFAVSKVLRFLKKILSFSLLCSQNYVNIVLLS